MIEFPLLPEGSTVVGVGIDQIEVSRIRGSIERHGQSFLDKVFTPEEKVYCGDKSDPAVHLAARFAAKEAAAKALGTGIGGKFGWLDFEVVKNEDGRPLARFSPHASKLLVEKSAGGAYLSLSHLQEVASAVVVLVGK